MDQTPTPSHNPQFPATRWSIVLAAAGRDDKKARTALEELCRIYWSPLYTFALRWGCSQEDAEDHTQQFLAGIADSNIFATTSPERGRLRTFLLKAFQRDLVDAVRSRDRQKRGGHIAFVPLDAAECQLDIESRQDLSPEAAYDRAWALASIQSAVTQLEQEYGKAGRSVIFTALRPFLDPEATGDYSEATALTGIPANALRQAVFRLRQRFRTLLRSLISDTLAQPTESMVDEELRAIQSALSR